MSKSKNEENLFSGYAVGSSENKKRKGATSTTKENVYIKVKNNSLDNFIEVKANKQRVNFTINPFLWEELGHITENKSKFVSDMLKKVIEEHLEKKIYFVNYDVD